MKIKLKAWDPSLKSMWDLSSNAQGIVSHNITSSFDQTGKLELMVNQTIDRNTVKRWALVTLFYTGCFDKYGKEICEGDIVEWSRTAYHFPDQSHLQTITYKSPVIWKEGSFLISEGQLNNCFLCAYADEIPGSESNMLTIIGNIYHNPELLKLVVCPGCAGDGIYKEVTVIMSETEIYRNATPVGECWTCEGSGFVNEQAGKQYLNKKGLKVKLKPWNP